MTSKWAVIAVGGNALIKDPQHKTVQDQYKAAKETMRHIAGMIEQGWEITIGHGNGPQVGFILRRSEIAEKVAGMHPVPLDACGADSQGAIGYAFQQNLYNEFKRRGMKRSVATVVTQVLVDRNDPAFEDPTKPIGSFMDKTEARQRAENDGWAVVEDAGRGWRRVVPSPYPQRIIELDVVKKLLEAGVITIAVGGGGIPVIENDEGELEGVAAVIDKDHASALLARQLEADLFVISTAVEYVYLSFDTPDRRPIREMTAAQAKQYIGEGQFARGSMLPKIEAAIYYLKYGGKEVIVTDPPNIPSALRGETGTRIIP